MNEISVTTDDSKPSERSSVLEVNRRRSSGDALVGVVGASVGHFEAVVHVLAEPAFEEAARQPHAPAHLQHQREVATVDRPDDVQRDDDAELEQQRTEGREVLVLE
jgi:hypothetical protein